jgi:hypothetical protein
MLIKIVLAVSIVVYPYVLLIVILFVWNVFLYSSYITSLDNEYKPEFQQ